MKIYKSNIVSALRILADYERQKAIWLRETDTWSSFNDEVEAVFLDSGIEEMLNQNKIVFDQETDSALMELLKAADDIGYHRNEHELVHTREMERLRQIANRALALVEDSNGSQSSVEIVE